MNKMYCSTFHVRGVVCSDKAPISHGYVVATTVLAVFAFFLVVAFIGAVVIACENGRMADRSQNQSYRYLDESCNKDRKIRDLKAERDHLRMQRDTLGIRDILRRRTHAQLKGVVKRLDRWVSK